VALMLIDADTSVLALLLAVSLLGCGMGLLMLSLLLAAQHGVDRSLLGVATSLNQFARSVGAAIGVAVMGAIFARSLSSLNLPGGVQGMASAGIQLDAAGRAQFAHALNRVFAAGAVMSVVGLIASFFLPPVDFARGVPAGAGEHLLTAEMTTLDSDGAPDAVIARVPAKEAP